jgi:hypothetical protein
VEHCTERLPLIDRIEELLPHFGGKPFPLWLGRVPVLRRFAAADTRRSCILRSSAPSCREEPVSRGTGHPDW